MTTPSPIALAIDNLLAASLAQTVAPLLERIAALEAQVEGLTGDKFDEAVMESIRDQAEAVVDLLEDEIKERVAGVDKEDLGDKVSAIIRSGSFNVEFSRY